MVDAWMFNNLHSHLDTRIINIISLYRNIFKNFLAEPIDTLRKLHFAFYTERYAVFKYVLFIVVSALFFGLMMHELGFERGTWQWGVFDLVFLFYSILIALLTSRSILERYF